MAGSLVLIDSETASTSATITLTGIDSTYDVYMVVLENVIPVTDNVMLKMRFQNSSGDVTSSNYDWANKVLKTYSAFDNDSATNQDSFELTDQELGTATGEVGNAVMYLFNTSNSSEYSFFTIEATCIDDNGNLFGNQGSGVLTVAESHTAVTYYMASGNIDSGEFKLYGLKK
jgi:hypothetical protein